MKTLDRILAAVQARLAAARALIAEYEARKAAEAAPVVEPEPEVAP